MSKGVSKLANAVNVVNKAQRKDYTLDDAEEYEAVRVLVRVCQKLLKVQGIVGTIILDGVTKQEH